MRNDDDEYGRIDFKDGLKTDHIYESTSGSGVIVDGCLFKDGEVDATKIQGVTVDDTEKADLMVLGYDAGAGNIVYMAGGGGGGGAPVTYPYAGFGTSGSLTQEVNLYSFYGRNLIKNSPGQIVTDGSEPQWWDDSANATITDEDCAGESIADITERCFKVVTTDDDAYGYQTFTFADEELLDAGQTVVSLGVWVWCASASKASVGIYGSNLGLEESSQHTGSSSWELLTVENITLDASDTSIEVRLILDTGTAYFAMPMLNQGSRALPWKPRGIKHIATTLLTQILVASGGGDVAWSDTDCTANTDPLAVMVQGYANAKEPNGTVGSYFATSHHSDITGVDNSYTVVARTQYNNIQMDQQAPLTRCNDSQAIRYTVSEIDDDNDMSYALYVTGYFMWE